MQGNIKLQLWRRREEEVSHAMRKNQRLTLQAGRTGLPWRGENSTSFFNFMAVMDLIVSPSSTICVLTSQSLLPQNVTVFGDRAKGN